MYHGACTPILLETLVLRQSRARMGRIDRLANGCRFAAFASAPSGFATNRRTRTKSFWGKHPVDAPGITLCHSYGSDLVRATLVLVALNHPLRVRMRRRGVCGPSLLKLATRLEVACRPAALRFRMAMISVLPYLNRDSLSWTRHSSD